MEVWKDIEGYEGLYQVSNIGRVKSLEKYVPGKNGCKQVRRERILNCSVNGSGYPHFSIYKDGVVKTVLVHRIVASAFLDNPLQLPEVNHIDGDKTNNRSENLEWCTEKQNVRHAWENGINRMTDKHRESARKVGLNNGKKVLCSNGVVYPSGCEAARQLGLSQGNVWSVLNGKRKHTKGYTFKFV